MKNENEGDYVTVEAEVVQGNDEQGLLKSEQALTLDYPETEHPTVDDVIDVNAEVYDASTAGVDGSDVTVPEDAPFPLQINGDELSKALQSEDPGRFVDSLAQSGLIVGRIVSLALKMAKGAKYERGKVAKVEADGVTVSYLNGDEKKWPYEKLRDIEILHKGQRFGAHELMYPMYGVSEEKMLPHLRALTSGNETRVQTTKEDGTELNAKLCLYRSKEKASAGYAKMYAVYGSEKLDIRDIPKLGIYFSADQVKELTETGKLQKPYEAKVDGQEQVVYYRVVVDKELNVVRVSKLQQKFQQNVELSKSQLIGLVKHLQANGFINAWVDVSTPEKIKQGILLHHGAGVDATLKFKMVDGKFEPKLNVRWDAPEDQGIGKAAYIEIYKPAVEKAGAFLGEKKESQKVGSGEVKPTYSTRDEAVIADAKKSQSQENKKTQSPKVG